MLKSLLGLGAFISICLGLVFFVYFSGVPFLVPGTLALAAILTVAWLYIERKSVKRFFTQKSTRYGANLILIIFLVLGILVFANILGRDYNYRKDITKLGINTLSEQTLKVLRELPTTVKVIYLAREDQQQSGEALLRRYTYESKKLAYEVLDPNRYPARVKAMGLDKIENDLLVLQLGEKKVTVQGLTEEKITNGLVRLLKTKNQTVGFTVGHGEHSIDGQENSQDSIAALKGELEKEAFVTKNINLFAEGKIPEDVTVLVILGPKTAFFPKEIEILKAWIAKGGRLLVGLDLDLHSSGLYPGAKQVAELIKDYGIVVGNQLLVDPTSRAANVEPQVLMAFAGSKEHPITKDFPTSTVGLVANFLFPLTARLTIPEKTPEDIKVDSLAKTTPSAWAEADWSSVSKGAVRFDEGVDFKGEMNLGYVLEKVNGPKMVVFGTSSIALDTVLNFSGNRDLLMNSFAWLSDNSEFISIRPKEEGAKDTLEINANLLGIIRLLVIFVLPISTMITGIWVWHRRRGK